MLLNVTFNKRIEENILTLFNNSAHTSDFILWRRAPQQMLWTHHSLEVYCATL
jgi:hypothetical protein